MELEQHLETTVKAHDQMLHRRVDLLLRTGKVLVESLADTNKAPYQHQLYHADGECER